MKKDDIGKDNLAQLLIEELDLDPDQMKNMKVTWGAENFVEVTWDGVTRMTYEKFNELLAKTGGLREVR